MDVAVALPAHVSGVEELGVESAIASVVDRDFLRGDPFVPPPVVAGVGKIPCLDLMPDPVFPEGAAKLIDEHLLESLEEVLRDFEEATELGACGADEDHEGLGGKTDASGDLAHDGADEWLEGGAGVFVFETLDGFAGLELGNEGTVVEGLGGDLLVVGALDIRQAATEADGFVAGDGEGDLGSGFGGPFLVGHILGKVVAIDDGVVQPGDAAWVARAADVAEVQHVGGGHVLVFPIRPVGDDAVAGGRAELIKEHAVVGAVGGVGGAADGLAADESDAGAACFGADELGEEVAVDGDLAEDEGLRAVEIHLGAGVERP